MTGRCTGSNNEKNNLWEPHTPCNLLPKLEVMRFQSCSFFRISGAFLIPYGIMLVVIGLPIFFLELVVGQYSGMGAIESFKNIAPLFHGIGVCTLVVITYVTIYYMVIVSWTMFYTYESFSSELPWGSCQHDYNSNSKLKRKF